MSTGLLDRPTVPSDTLPLAPPPSRPSAPPAPQAPAAPGSAAGWLRAGWRALLDGLRQTYRTEPELPPEVRRDLACQVLAGARQVLERGWVQEGWYSVRDRSGRPRLVGSTVLGVPRPADIVGACLVGAIAHVASRDTTNHRAAAAAALDALWETLRRSDAAVAAVPDHTPLPVARAFRSRDLVRWNDQPGRTKADVLALVDRALATPPVR
jgi:hypothetical protein